MPLLAAAATGVERQKSRHSFREVFWLPVATAENGVVRIPIQRACIWYGDWFFVAPSKMRIYCGPLLCFQYICFTVICYLNLVTSWRCFKKMLPFFVFWNGIYFFQSLGDQPLLWLSNGFYLDWSVISNRCVTFCANFSLYSSLRNSCDKTQDIYMCKILKFSGNNTLIPRVHSFSIFFYLKTWIYRPLNWLLHKY